MSFSSLLPPPEHSPPDDVNSREVEIITKEHDFIVNALTKKEAVHSSNNNIESFVGSQVANFNDVIPLRQKDFYGVQAPLPTTQEIELCKVRTQEVVNRLLHKFTDKGKAGYQKDTRKITTGSRIITIESKRQDPLQPSRQKNTSSKIVLPEDDETDTPILHATDDAKSKRLTKEERAKWNIPAAVSSWKNPMGYTVGLKHRAAHGKKTGNVGSINNKVSDIVAALDETDQEIREGIQQENELKRKQLKEEERVKEEKLRAIAERSKIQTQSSAVKKRGSRFEGGRHQNKKIKKEEPPIKSAAERLKELAYAQGREVSEKVILGAAKATTTGAGANVHYDSRLFSKGANAAAKRSEEQVYDNPLFVQQEIDSIYRVNAKSIDEANSASASRYGPIQFTKAHSLDDKSTEKDEEET